MNLRIGQPVRIELGITDPINMQGETGTIIKLDQDEEVAVIKFDNKKQGKYSFGTFNIEDDNNEKYLFHGDSTYLLALIAKGELNAQDLAKNEPKARGLDVNGSFVGWSK